MKTKLIRLTCFLTALLALATVARAQGTTFTYQGSLTQNGAAVTGPQDFEFRLFNAALGGVQIGSVLTLGDVGVTNGLFTVALDFGAAFDGAARFLDLTVRPGASTGAYTNLAPRQPLTSTPYAVRAANFSGAVADNQLSSNIARLNASATFAGPVSFSNTSNQFSGTFIGSAAGLTNLNITSSFGGGVAFELGTLAFFLSSSPVVGDGPYSVVAADVNGDGKADLISANYYGDTLTVLTNNGSGGFVLSSSPAVGAPYSVAAADVNGDGKMDLISGHDIDNTLTVLTNNGSGGFVLASSPAVGNRPQSVAAADVNGDGKVDLISANYGVNTLSVLTNNGSGGFVLSSSPVVGNGPQSVVAADVNGDGKVDLISGNIDASTLSVLTNNGSGGFVLSSSPGVGTPSSVAAADVNGDGKVDLISANQSANTLTVLTNNGSGAFALSSSPAVGNMAIAVTAADVNGDGRVDLISANYSNPGTLSVLTNNGSGSFALASSPTVGDGPISVVAAEVNGDGKEDLITANFGGGGGNTLTVLFNSRLLNGVFAGNGTGLRGVDAELLDGLDGSAFARLAADQDFTGLNTFAGDSYFYGPIGFSESSYFGGASTFAGASTFNGNVAVGSSTAISFGAQTRQMLNLWGSAYGVGVQSGTFYQRSGGGFAWFKGGIHSDVQDDAGTGGTSIMRLSSAGELHIGGGVFAGLSLENRTTPAQRWVLYSRNEGDGSGRFAIWSGGDKLTLDASGNLRTTGAVNPSSDRNVKAGFAPTDAKAILEKVAALPITRWHYTNDTATPHVGPMAQDFHAAFGLGTDNKHIATVDADGVALAAIQGLNQKVEEATQRKDAEIAELAHQNAELLRRLEALEQKLR